MLYLQKNIWPDHFSPDELGRVEADPLEYMSLRQGTRGTSLSADHLPVIFWFWVAWVLPWGFSPDVPWS